MVFSKDNVVNTETVDVKRSKRLSQKRSCQGKSLTENKDGSKDVKRRKCETKNSLRSRVESEKSEVLRNGTEKTSDRISTELVAGDGLVCKASDVRPLTSAADEANIPVKSTSTTAHKSTSTSKSVIGLEKNDANEEDVVISDKLERDRNVAFKRKRGRPPLKKTRERNTDVIIASNHAGAGGELREVEGPTGTFQDFGEPEELDDPAGSGDENPDGETPPAANVGTDETFRRPFRPGSLERALFCLSERFGVPAETLGRMVAEESVPAFDGECRGGPVAPSAVTVSPVVAVDGRPDVVGYAVEPARESAAYGTDSLKELMDELSRTMPSWCLSVVPDPRRYVIAHVSIGPYGVPVADKSIVLDRHCRASVYVDQCLQFKYGKRYQSAPEIVDLIKELNSI